MNDCSPTNNDDPSSVKLSKYNWSKANFEMMNDLLSTVNWHNLFGFQFETELLWSNFKCILWPIIDCCTPKILTNHSKKYKIRNYPKQIRILLNRKKSVWALMRTNKTPQLLAKYKKLANECKLAIHHFDVERENRILDANNLGAFYRFVNSKLGNSSGIGPLHDQDSNLLFDDKAKAELLNQYFHSVFISDNGILPHFPSRFKFTPQNLNDVTFDIPDIIKILKKLKTNSAAGPDNLPPIFYNKTAHNIAYPLKQLFRTFIDSRTLPQEWKNSIITPKFKKGLSTDPANYRPIALTCSACKVLESLITSSLIQFLTDHNLISPSQHGFLKKHSTTTNLLSSLRDWTISLSNHKSTHICYIDFQRAFDTISHTKLIQKLTSYGVSGNLLFWIKSFLTNRYQCVRINSSQSSNLPVISGIPQGSVLGPILFNIFINDISDNFSDDVRTQLFADDLKLYTDLDLTHTPNTLQIHLDHIQTWSAKWQLYISNNKCFHFTIGHENHPNTLILSNSIVPHCSSIKDLGVILDSSLKYKSHIMDISARAKQRAALIHRCFASRSIKNLTRAYITYIRPMLEYATTVWSPSQIYLINTIESVQKQFTK
jgi:hypothetical protein